MYSYRWVDSIVSVSGLEENTVYGVSYMGGSALTYLLYNLERINGSVLFSEVIKMFISKWFHIFESHHFNAAPSPAKILMQLCHFFPYCRYLMGRLPLHGLYL
jgi:hypothetical protein